jgi:cold shock CspA family protein/ribosome-associated translation inhibitor RaiA
MQTPVQITFRNLESSDAIMSNIQERTAWLEQFSDQIISCRIVVERPHQHHRQDNLYHVRIDLRLPGAELVISREPAAHMPHKNINITIHDAFDEARRELEDYVRRQRRDVKHIDSPPHAYVIRLIHEDGRYGFIRTEDDRELYFHSNTVLNGQYEQLEVGTEVKYAEEMGEEGPQASTVEIVGKSGRHFRTNLPRAS